MKFAQFQSTYKPLPLDVYEKTGQELEEKYYRNREQSSLLRQALSNTKVEDRNIGALAKATTDVENILSQVDGKWHYASNILYNAKDRLLNDKVLTASIEDYAKSQAAKEVEQKKFQDGKIDQEALNSFYINNERYNSKGIELDANGQTINRWSTPTPPPKVDTTEQVLKIVTLLNQHADSLAVPGTDLLAVYKANPRLQGFVDKYTNKGKDPSKLGEAVQNWMNSTPEVKQYYDYINDAKVFNMITERDTNGKYLRDQNGNFVQKDITPEDFRNIGIPVLDNWNNQSNTMLLPGINGTLNTVKINNLAPNFKDSQIYKEYKEAGFTDQEALQQIYKRTLTGLQTDKIVDFARSFGYNQLSSNTIEDKMFFYRLDRQKELDKNRDIYNIMPGITTNVKRPDYNSKDTQKLIGDLIKERSSIPTDPKIQTTDDKLRYNQLDYEIKNLQNREKLLRSSYLNSPEGRTYTNELFSDFVGKARNKKDKNLILQNRTKVIEYLSGQSEELGFDIPSYFFGKDLPSIKRQELRIAFPFGLNPSAYPGEMSESTNPGRMKSAFNDAITKKIQSDGLEVSYETGILTDENGAPSKAMEALNNFVQNNASEFIVINQVSRYKDRRETLGQLVNEDLKGKNPALYQFNVELPKGRENDGVFFLRITPRVTGSGEPMAEPLKQDTYTIEPNPTNKPEVMRNLGTIGITQDKTGVGGEWGKQQIANTMYRQYFEDIENTLAQAREQDPDVQFIDLGEQYFVNVPMKDNTGEVGFYNFKLVPTDTDLQLYQLDNNGNMLPEFSTFKSLRQVEDSFKEAFFKEEKK